MKLLSENLNPDPYPPQFTSTYTCRVTIAPRVCGGILYLTITCPSTFLPPFYIFISPLLSTIMSILSLPLPFILALLIPILLL